jgi:CRISPR-associated protein Cas6
MRRVPAAPTGGPQEIVVDMAFVVNGGAIPADHGYLLMAAISRHLPELHGDESIGIHPIGGQLVGGRQLSLTRESRVTLRFPASKVGQAVRLAGRRLDLGGASVTLGVPSIHSLTPVASLTSRLVVISGFTDAEPFLEAARRQLEERGIGGVATLVRRVGSKPLEGRTGSATEVMRRTLRIREREIVGFAVRVDDLGPEGSLRLQAVGIGGRRRFGCGIFVPAPEKRSR